MYRTAITCVLLPLSFLQQAAAKSPNRFIERGVTRVIGHQFGHNPVSVWSGGALVTVQDARSSAPLFKCFDRDGREVCRFVLEIPGASRIKYHGAVARGFDGALAIAGSASTNDERGGLFLASISPDAKQQTIVRINPYSARAVSVSADGSIWTAGIEKDGDYYSERDYRIVRRFDRSGKLLSSHVPRSRFAVQDHVRYGAPAEYSTMVSSRDGRVGWFAEAVRRYVEFDLEGNILREVATDELFVPQDGQPPEAYRTILGVALCDGGNLFVSEHWLEPESNTRGWGIFSLGADGWTYTPQEGMFGFLYGCDGETLVGINKDPSLLKWLDYERPE